MKSTGLILATLLSLGATLVLGGTEPFGRLALEAGFPRLAIPLFDDPQWRGVAEYRAGDYQAAAQSFLGPGPTTSFNRGNSLAMQESWAAALESYDRALAQNPDDGDARQNFDLIAAFYGAITVDPAAPVKWFEKREGDQMAAPLGEGSGRASGTGDETTNTGANMGLPGLVSEGRRSVRQVFDAKMIVASERWLATLADVPGDYLAARIKEEQKRRKALGIDQPKAEDPL